MELLEPDVVGAMMKPGLSMLLAALALAMHTGAVHAGAAPARESVGADVPDAQRRPVARKPAVQARDARAAPTAWWYDRGVRRPLHVDRELVADFAGQAPRSGPGARPTEPSTGAGRAGRQASPLRQRDSVEKSTDTLPAGASPVFRDAGGAPRALPGGVIVRLRDTDLQRARERLVAAGLKPVRANDPEGRTWLVESAPGLPALELANRLHETGEFEWVEPNWWRPRVVK